MSFLKTESYKQGLFYSVIFNALARMFGFAASLAIAYYFGAGVVTDIYFYCIFSAGLLAGVASSLNSAVLIPESMRLFSRHGERESQEFLNFFLYIFLALGAAFSLVGLMFPVQLFGLLSKFSHAALAQNKTLLLLAVPIFTLMKISNYLSDILVSRKFFTMPMIAGMIVNMAVLFFIFTLGPYWGAASMASGMLLAHVCNIAFMAWLMKTKLGWDFGFRNTELAPHVPRNVVFAQLGSGASVVASYVPMFLLTGLSAGTVSAMNYGRQVAELPNTLLAQQTSSVAGIKFNELTAAGDHEGLRRIYGAVSRPLIGLLVPAALFGFVYSREIISLLYQRGSFDAVAVTLTADFLGLFMLLLPLLAMSSLYSRLLMAEQRVKEGFWIQLAFNGLLTLLAYALVRWVGAVGYPLAIILMQCGNISLVWLLLRRWIPAPDYAGSLRHLALVCAFYLPIALAAWAGRRLLQAPPAVELALGLALFVLPSLPAIKLLHVADSDSPLRERWDNLKQSAPLRWFFHDSGA